MTKYEKEVRRIKAEAMRKIKAIKGLNEKEHKRKVDARMRKISKGVEVGKCYFIDPYHVCVLKKLRTVGDFYCLFVDRKQYRVTVFADTWTATRERVSITPKTFFNTYRLGADALMALATKAVNSRKE